MSCTHPNSERDVDAPTGAPASSDGPLSEAQRSLHDCAERTNRALLQFVQSMTLMAALAEQTNRALLALAQATAAVAEQAVTIIGQNAAILESLAEQDEEEEDAPTYLDGRPRR
jgi:hypothetical protein